MLITVQGGAHVLARGAQKAVPVAVNEENAMQAIFKGGMWLPNATGGREYAKYDHHLIHDNGDWTWVGKVQTDHGLQSAVITFGKDAVFGLIPQASGNALRLVTADGQKLLVQTDGAKMAASALTRQLYARQDFKIPSHKAASSAKRTASASATTSTTSASAPMTASAATTSGGPTIDVMVAYTPGLVSAYGSTSAALTRINNLVDITNQAYSDSGVNQRIRLVDTMQVGYTDTNSNNTALDDITGNDGNGNSVPIPSSLQGVASVRAQYGADLVVLLRHFNNAGNGGCGVGWLIGGGGVQIDPTQDNAFGYSVVQDGSDSGYYCLDTTFAHELGHNMGSAHDRAHADKPGAYPYSYGYVGNGANGFATIMAYGSNTQTPVNYFSNPNISVCQNSPCGVADTSTSSADNVHSLDNTASLIAQFEPTEVAVSFRYVHDDINGDGKSDLIWRTQNKTSFAYWIMNGAQLSDSATMPVPANYRILATGDFNGDGKMDIIWTDGVGMWMWVGDGSGFTNTYMRSYPSGWTVVGTSDLNGDGRSDLIWAAPGQISEWLMNGASFTATYLQNLQSGWWYLTTGDFDGDGKADLLLTNGTAMQIWTQFNNGSFTPVATHNYPLGGWTILGTGDLNGDGKDDLLWRDNTHNWFAYWNMNGAQLANSAAIYVSPDWQFDTAGDFDGSGVLGLVWYNSNQIVMWPGSSTGNYKGVVVHSYPSGWTILP